MDKRIERLVRRLGRRPRRVAVCAHRGDRANAPENTLSAFRSAIALGVEAIEFDVHLTRDNTLVCVHDSDVARCSNGQGAVREMTLRALRRLDFGEWFNPRFKGERIPTLGEALELMKGKAFPVIEIKRDAVGYSPEAERLTLEALDAAGLRRDAILICFDGRVLQRLHRMDGRLLLGALGRNDPAYLPRWVQGYHPPIEESKAERVAQAHEGGHWVLPWNANDQPAMRRQIEYGVDILASDYPEILERLMRDLGEPAPPTR
jgi:glycerophosphoryl diester phosphodiesterase